MSIYAKVCVWEGGKAKLVAVLKFRMNPQLAKSANSFQRNPLLVKGKKAFLAEAAFPASDFQPAYGAMRQDLAALHARLDVLAGVSDAILGVVHTDSAVLRFAITLKQKRITNTHTHTHTHETRIRRHLHFFLDVLCLHGNHILYNTPTSLHTITYSSLLLGKP